MARIKILIVEDEPLITEDLRGHLEEMEYEVCAVCDNALDAMAEMAVEKPDLWRRTGGLGLHRGLRIHRGLHPGRARPGHGVAAAQRRVG